MSLNFDCKCGNNKFLIITEKLYEGMRSKDGILICEPEEQHISEIKCSKCGMIYDEKDFEEVNY